MRRILLVDDLLTARAIRLHLQRRFGPGGTSTTDEGLVLAFDAAAELEGALRLLRQRPDAEPYHALIVDAERLTFEELAFLLHVARLRFPDVRALLLGALSDDHLAELAPQVGAHAFLPKPLDLARIAEAVRPWIAPGGRPSRPP